MGCVCEAEFAAYLAGVVVLTSPWWNWGVGRLSAEKNIVLLLLELVWNWGVRLPPFGRGNIMPLFVTPVWKGLNRRECHVVVVEISFGLRFKAATTLRRKHRAVVGIAGLGLRCEAAII
jgi:hypothetical protein